MRLELVPDDTAKALVSRMAPMGFAEFTDHDRGFRIVNGSGRTTAAAVFSDYRPHLASIEFSGIALCSHALSTRIVLQLGGYAFGQLRINRVFARTSEKNARAIKLLKHLGFTPEGTSADFYGVGLNARNYRMLKREWDERYPTLVKEAA